MVTAYQTSTLGSNISNSKNRRCFVVLISAVCSSMLLMLIKPTWWMGYVRKAIKSLFDEYNLGPTWGTIYSSALLLDSPLFAQPYMATLFVVAILRLFYYKYSVSRRWLYKHLSVLVVTLMLVYLVVAFFFPKTVISRAFYQTDFYYGVYILPHCRPSEFPWWAMITCRWLSITAFSVVHFVVLHRLISRHFAIWLASCVALSLVFSTIPVFVAIVGQRVNVGCWILQLLGFTYGLLVIGVLWLDMHLRRIEKKVQAICGRTD